MEIRQSKIGVLEHKRDDLSRVENGVSNAKLASDKKIPEYIIAGDISKGRILIMESSVSKKYRFCQVIDGRNQVITFSDINGTCYGSAIGDVLVFKKPHPTTFHKMLMRENARCHWLGENVDGKRIELNEEKILQNMMELLEII